MSGPSIEQTLRPETANEVLLIGRIDELKRKMWESGRHFNTSDGLPPDPNAVPVAVRDFTPTLRLAGTFRAEMDLPRGLRIEARTNGPTMFGLANYVSAIELRSMGPHVEGRLVDHLWRTGMHSLAGEMKRLLAN